MLSFIVSTLSAHALFSCFIWFVIVSFLHGWAFNLSACLSSCLLTYACVSLQYFYTFNYVFLDVSVFILLPARTVIKLTDPNQCLSSVSPFLLLLCLCPFLSYLYNPTLSPALPSLTSRWVPPAYFSTSVALSLFRPALLCSHMSCPCIQTLFSPPSLCFNHVCLWRGHLTLTVVSFSLPHHVLFEEQTVIVFNTRLCSSLARGLKFQDLVAKKHC